MNNVKEALNETMGIVTLNELQDVYESVTNDLTNLFNLEPNQILSFTFENLEAMEDILNEDKLDQLYNFFESIKKLPNDKLITYDDGTIEIKKLNDKIYGYEDLDGLDAFWLNINDLNEKPFI